MIFLEEFQNKSHNQSPGRVFDGIPGGNCGLFSETISGETNVQNCSNIPYKKIKGISNRTQFLHEIFLEKFWINSGKISRRNPKVILEENLWEISEKMHGESFLKIPPWISVNISAEITAKKQWFLEESLAKFLKESREELKIEYLYKFCRNLSINFQEVSQKYLKQFA